MRFTKNDVKRVCCYALIFSIASWAGGWPAEVMAFVGLLGGELIRERWPV